MAKKEFSKKELEEIKELLKKTNQLLELHKEKSLKAIGEMLGIDRSTLTKRFGKIGYVYDKKERQYIKEILSDITDCNMENKQSINLDNETIKDILEVVEWYKSNKKDLIEEDENTLLTGKTTTRSFKIYNNVLEKFDKYCTDNPILKKQDIVNKAILEYIKNN